MAVWLSLSLSQGTPNESTRTTTVTATVTIHYSGGSYNGNSPSGQLTIDGQSFDFNCNFNYAGIGLGAVTTGTGSVTAVTKTVTVDYGTSNTRTIYANASFASGTASGTVTASDSLNLTTISSGGGSSGGDSGDDDSGGSTDTLCRIYMYADTGVSYKYTLLSGHEIFGSRYTPGSQVKIEVWADDGYELTSCTINGVSTTSTTMYLYSDVTINATAKLAESGGDDTGGGNEDVPPITRGVVYIDTGSEFVEYQGFLDTGTDWVPIILEVSE